MALLWASQRRSSGGVAELLLVMALITLVLALALVLLVLPPLAAERSNTRRV